MRKKRILKTIIRMQNIKRLLLFTQNKKTERMVRKMELRNIRQLQIWLMEQARKERSRQMQALCTNDVQLQQAQAELRRMANAEGVSEADIKAALWEAHVASEAYRRCMANGSPRQQLDYGRLSDAQFRALDRAISRGRRA